MPVSATVACPARDIAIDRQHARACAGRGRQKRDLHDTRGTRRDGRGGAAVALVEVAGGDDARHRERRVAAVRDGHGDRGAERPLCLRGKADRCGRERDRRCGCADRREQRESARCRARRSPRAGRPRRPIRRLAWPVPRPAGSPACWGARCRGRSSSLPWHRLFT